MSKLLELINATTLLISKKINRSLNTYELKLVTDRLKSLSIITKNTMMDVVNDLLSQILNTHFEVKMDFKQYQNKEIGIEEEDNMVKKENAVLDLQIDAELSLEVATFLQLNSNDLFRLSAKLNPSSKQFYAYILLDTTSAAPTNIPSDQTVSQWNWYLNWGGAPVYEAGYLNLYYNLYDIIKMRLGRVTFANLWDTDLALLQTDRIVYQIAEFNDQAIIDPTPFKFSFTQYEFSQYGNNITMTAFNANQGWFRFRKPYRPPDSITLSIYDIISNVYISIHQTPFVATGTQIVGLSVVIAGVTYQDPLLITSGYDMFHVPYVPASSFTGTSTQSYIIAGFTTLSPGILPDSAVIAAYNGTKPITLIAGSSYAIPPVADLSTTGCNFGVLPAFIPITITWLYAPRITGALEIVYEIPHEEKIT